MTISPAGPVAVTEVQELRAHGLRYTSDDEPGIRRRRRGRGFGYTDDSGDPVDASDRARIDKLAVPPAWTNVWICRDPRGHLQATGRDNRGRKQHRYHANWRVLRDTRKFANLGPFADRLPGLRRQIAEDLQRRGFDEDKMTALVLALLDATLIRVGNDEYVRTNGTFGLTTLTRRHVDLGPGGVAFRFVGKSNIRHVVSVDDRRLARLVRRCHELGGRELFSFVDADGTTRRIDSGSANDYLRQHAGPEHTVKTFRTWGASVLGLEYLASSSVDGPAGPDHINKAVDLVAARLGNTRAVARSSYVHPSIGPWSASGELADAWQSSRSGKWMSRAERALLRLIASDGATSP